MVRHHVTKRSGHVKVAAAFFYAHSFRHGNLDMVDVTPVPDGLKNTVAEAKHQDVLDRFFAKIMVDAENLPFRQHLADLAVQGFGRFQAIAKRLFEDHATPAPVMFASE